MNLAEAILAHFASAGLLTQIPGGLNLDVNLEPQPPQPWAIIEDQGGNSEQSSTGDGPTDTTVVCWVFGEPEKRVRDAAVAWKDAIKDAVFELDTGPAYAMVTSPPRIVTEAELMKPVQTAFQASFTVVFQQ